MCPRGLIHAPTRLPGVHKANRWHLSEMGQSLTFDSKEKNSANSNTTPSHTENKVSFLKWSGGRPKLFPLLCAHRALPTPSVLGLFVGFYQLPLLPPETGLSKARQRNSWPRSLPALKGASGWLQAISKSAFHACTFSHRDILILGFELRNIGENHVRRRVFMLQNIPGGCVCALGEGWLGNWRGR